MKTRSILLLIAAVLIIPACVVDRARAAPAQRKSAKQCNDEERANLAALKDAGESFHDFIHECWWVTAPGTPTPIRRREAADPSKVDAKSERIAAAPAHTSKATEVSPSDRLKKGRGRRAFAGLAHERHRDARRHTHRFEFASDSRHRFHERVAGLPFRGRRSEQADGGSRLRFAAKAADAVSRRAIRPRKYAGRGVDSRVALLDIPSNAIVGRRAWIGASTGGGDRKVSAVIIGPLVKTNAKGADLHCWGQNVLFVGHQARWAGSLVCDEKSEASPRKVWFETFK